ncbi:MAG: hypothetical protein ACTHLU_06840 [Novosphingobium sp.]
MIELEKARTALGKAKATTAHGNSSPAAVPLRLPSWPILDALAATPDYP